MNSSTRKRWALLVSKGYFPEELPPSFSAIDLYKVITNPNFKLENYEEGKNSTSKVLPFSIPKVKSHRRILGIPGPFHFVQLAQCIIQNEKAINAEMALSTFSIYKSHQNDSEKRYIGKPNFKALVKQRILRSTGYRYLLSVDINRFYPSIYTHSIPWAAHGKTFAKKNRGQNFYGNTLDKFCRNCQDGQTLGLPIGPDTSRIISELILSSVDKKLAEYMVNIPFTGIRNVDDYLLYFNSLASLEEGRTKLQKILREFELELNSIKEKILDLPEIIENEWRTAIRGFRFRKDRKLQQVDLIAYFDLCYGMARKFPEELIIPYAIAKLRSIKMHRSNWGLLQAFLLNSLVLESKAIEQVTRELRLYKIHHNYLINKKRVKAALESFLKYHAAHDNHFEIVWALWYFDQEGLTLSREIGNLVCESSNDLVILSLLNLDRNDFLEEELDISKWAQFITPEHLHSEHWLIAYEAVVQGYYQVNNDYFDGHPFFELLKKRNVSFFNSSIEEDQIIELDASGSSLAKELADESSDSDNDLGLVSFEDENDD